MKEFDLEQYREDFYTSALINGDLENTVVDLRERFKTPKLDKLNRDEKIKLALLYLEDKPKYEASDFLCELPSRCDMFDLVAKVYQKELTAENVIDYLLDVLVNANAKAIDNLLEDDDYPHCYDDGDDGKGEDMDYDYYDWEQAA